MNWSITGITTRNTPNAGTIVVVSFLVSDGISSIANDVRVDEIDPNNFIPLSEITEQQVIEWVKAALGNARVGELESLVEQKTNAPAQDVATILPWNN
jgi:hypothetical protein